MVLLEKLLVLLPRRFRFMAITSVSILRNGVWSSICVECIALDYALLNLRLQQGVGGAVELAPGYLKLVYDIIRKAGGVCIADEVQTGFGRTGSHYWGFETQGVIPDIVTMAKVLVAILSTVSFSST